MRGLSEGLGRGGRPTRAAIGFTVKSGWAAVVLLAGPAASPHLVDSCTVDLSDPRTPDTRQPYHAGFGTARDTGPELSRLIGAVTRLGRRSVAAAIRRYQDSGCRLCGAGVVVGSLIDPDSIANDHIRIHALEGQLFRRVVTETAARSGLPVSVWRERDLHARADLVLKMPEPTLRDALASLGRAAGGPWRAEQKAAALSAWLVLRQRSAVARASTIPGERM
jgi:hypothetical protein